MSTSHVKINAPGVVTACGNSERAETNSLRMLELGSGVMLNEEAFQELLLLERRRAERSRRPFVLMLMSFPSATSARGASIEAVAAMVSGAIRESDLVGWYDDRSVLGVIFTELGLDGSHSVIGILQSKMLKVLHKSLDREVVLELVITCHLFPESWDDRGPDSGVDVKLYPEIHKRVGRKRIPTAIKRAIDIVGSSVLLLVLTPLLAIIAAAIKLTSKGPVIFRQERLGQFGRPFECLKFRTMYVNNDPGIHRDYVHNFIAGRAEVNGSAKGPKVFKIQSDPRITTVGQFLRKMSFDELPQFWNVLRGEMSLVGPRPPVRYEFEVYDHWHRRRVLEVKPGVTGLWQVSGRSRTCFDDMVRLDLRYSQEWSLWLDLKILLATPAAVFTGDGAY